MNNRVEEVEIYTLWRIKMKRRNEEAGWTRARERASASRPTQSSCTSTHTASHDKLHQRRGGGMGEEEEGGTAQRALVLPWTDTHLNTHTHTHIHTTAQGPSLRSTALSWLPEPRCVLSRIKKKKREKKEKTTENKETNQSTNKRTKERRMTRTLDPTGNNKKINQKRNLDYKKSQWHRVLQKAFSQWLAFEQLYAFSFSLPSIYY